MVFTTIMSCCCPFANQTVKCCVKKPSSLLCAQTVRTMNQPTFYCHHTRDALHTRSCGIPFQAAPLQRAQHRTPYLYLSIKFCTCIEPIQMDHVIRGNHVPDKRPCFRGHRPSSYLGLIHTGRATQANGTC